MLRALKLEAVAPDAGYFLSAANLPPGSLAQNAAFTVK